MAKLLLLSCCGSVVVVQLLWISCGSVVVQLLWLSCGSVVVAQLVEWSLPTPEIRCSNPDISQFYFLSTVLKTMLKRRE